MYSSDTIIIAAENKRKNRQPEYCVRRPFKVCDGCVKATLGTTTVTHALLDFRVNHNSCQHLNALKMKTNLLVPRNLLV